MWNNNKVLLLNRYNASLWNNNHWGLPGGAVLAHETTLQAAQRKALQAHRQALNDLIIRRAMRSPDSTAASIVPKTSSSTVACSPAK